MFRELRIGRVQEMNLFTLWRRDDHSIDLSGANVSQPARSGPDRLSNVASSRFLRPYNRRLAPLDGLRLRRITKAMEQAARTGGTFHVWWHPENFGRDLSENMAMLTNVLDQYQRLMGTYGMQSRAMHEVDGTGLGECEQVQTSSHAA